MLNFLGTVFTVDDVVRGYEKAMRTRRLEVYLPYSDSVSSRLAAFWPGASNRLMPLLDRIGRRGHAKYLARIESEDSH